MSAGAAIRWERLEHAYGGAADVPSLLDAISRASRKQLRKHMEELCGRVLHQGSLYSASAPAVHELLGMPPKTAARDKLFVYEVLAEFAASARSGMACCGQEEDCAAVLSEISREHARFAADLDDRDSGIRAAAATLLVASADPDAGAVQLLRDRYLVESNPSVRLSMLDGLTRVHAKLPDWREFLAGALQRETDSKNRCALRSAELHEWKADAPAAAVGEVIALSVETEGSRLLESLHELGEERELAALLQVVNASRDRDFLRPVTVRVLCLIFSDRRSGWGEVSSSILKGANAQTGSQDWVGGMFRGVFKLLLLLLIGKVFPFVLRWRLRKAAAERATRRERVEYWGVKGAAPEIPEKFSADQQRALTALAVKSELWFDATNLWALFGLPDNPVAMQEFVSARS